MKIMITIIGFLTAVAGLIPLVGSKGLGFLPDFIPTSGIGYAIVVILIGAGGLMYGIVNKMIMGAERIVTVSVAIITILGGIVPLASGLLPGWIPSSGILYYLMIILIGCLGFIYGIMSLG